MKKKTTAKKGWAVAVVVFMVFMMILFAASGLLSSFSNQSSVTQTTQQNNTLQPTQVIHYIPNISTSGMAVQNGSCWTNSIAEPYRTDAWRCTVGNSISDPCFEIQNTKNLFCGANPGDQTATSAFVLKLTQPLPSPDVTSSTTSSNWAWAVMLTDGTYCTPFTGTRPFAASGEAAYYACNSKDPTEEFIFNDLDSSSSIWTATVGSLSKSTSTYPPAIESMKVVPVKTVWQ